MKNKFWANQMCIYFKTIGGRKMSKKQEVEMVELAEFLKRKHHTGLFPQEIIDNINLNMSKENKNDNEIVIKFIQGDENIIWDLFRKYTNLYKSICFKYLNKREIHLEPEDIIIEFFMEFIEHIRFGKYIGISFKGYSCVILKYRIFAILKDRSQTSSIETNFFK